MRFLLDTHIFLWFIAGDVRLKPALLAHITSPANRRLLSIVSLWEIVIKASLGKLPLKGSISELIRIDIIGNDIELLPISLEHLDTLEVLPHHHGDPFDRMIVAQALTENLPLMTAVNVLDAYGVAPIS
jgi:PIN domain nuclease of toxin-antitoxin system